MNPKVYLIHASEDKEKFVTNFATKLREKGVDVWLDKWEMLPGDSLVDKMFEEGIKNAQAFIIVLSKISVTKPWVREELNASVIKKINNGSKIIPVIIEDCDIPEVLTSTLWERIKDTSCYDAEFNRIHSSIFGVNEKPALGPAPNYSSSSITIPGLNKIDSLIFNLLCDEAMNTKSLHVYPHRLDKTIIENDLDKNSFYESLEILEEENFISCTRDGSNTVIMVKISLYGFDIFVKQNRNDYDIIFTNVISVIVNSNLQNNEAITKQLELPELIVDYFLDLLENNNLLKLARTGGNLTFIIDISPKLKRMLES